MDTMIRNLHFGLVAFLLFMCTSPNSEETNNQTANRLTLFIGTYTFGESEGIYEATFDTITGDLSEVSLVAEASNPSFLTTANNGNTLIAVNENDPGTISTFVRDNNTYSSRQILPTQGIHPCHVAIDKKGELVSIANYSSGNISLLEFKKDQLVVRQTMQHEGSGPNEERQEGPHAHFSTFSPKGDFIYANDLGIDKVMAYPLADLDSNFVAWEAEPGDGPRHLDFHPAQNWVFVLNELSNTVNSFSIETNGTFAPIDRQSTLPKDFQEFSKAADIRVSSDGRYLYASNRGYDSIVIFQINNDGSLDRIGFTTDDINTPRNFALDPTGKFLLVANQDGNNLISFRILENGLLEKTGSQINVGSPVCIVFR